MRILCIAFLSIVTAALAAEQPKPVNLKDPTAVQKEVERIQKAHAGDPKRSLEEIKKLTDAVARANGVVEQRQAAIAKRDALFKKYGTPENYSREVDGHGHVLQYVDLSAWHSVIDKKDDVVSVTFHLDRERYSAVEVTPIVVLRTAGKDAQEENRLMFGDKEPSTPSEPVKYTRIGKNVFRAEIKASDAADGKVVQISAILEPVWSTVSVVKIK